MFKIPLAPNKNSYCPSRNKRITVVFDGDFQQILPVVRNGSRADIVFASLLRSRSAAWDCVEASRPKQNMCLTNDPNTQLFSSWLLDVSHKRRRGDDDTISLSREMIVLDIDAFIADIYHGIGSTPLHLLNTSSIG